MIWWIIKTDSQKTDINIKRTDKKDIFQFENTDKSEKRKTGRKGTRRKKKHADGGGGDQKRKGYGANTLFRKKENFKNEKIKNLVYFQIYDAIKHQNIAFEPIFSPVERFKHKNGVVIGLCLRKRLRTP